MYSIGERHYALQLTIGIVRELVDAFGEDYIRDEFEGAAVETHLALMEEYRDQQEDRDG